MSLLHVPKLNAFYKVIHTPYRNHHQCPRMGTKKVGKRMSYLEENPEYYKARCCYSKSYFKYQKKSFEKRHHKSVIQNPHYRWAEFRRRLINGHFYLQTKIVITTRAYSSYSMHIRIFNYYLLTKLTLGCTLFKNGKYKPKRKLNQKTRRYISSYIFFRLWGGDGVSTQNL